MKYIKLLVLVLFAVITTAEAETTSSVKPDKGVIVAKHTLNAEQQRTLSRWLKKHPTLQIKPIEECGCDYKIEERRNGATGMPPESDYNPYCVVGDFKDDGEVDFAIVLNDISRRENFLNDYNVLVIFNGPFQGKAQSPAFIQHNLNFYDYALFYGPQYPNKPKQKGISIGAFDSDVGANVIPYKNTYKLEAVEHDY